MERPCLLVPRPAARVACAGQKPDFPLRLGGRERKAAALAQGGAASLFNRTKILGMGGEHHLQHLDQVLRQMEAIGDLHRLGRAAARALGIGGGTLFRSVRDRPATSGA
jgi:hypothetical protein